MPLQPKCWLCSAWIGSIISKTPRTPRSEAGHPSSEQLPTWRSMHTHGSSIHGLGSHLGLVRPGPHARVGHHVRRLLDAHVVQELCIPCCSCGAHDRDQEAMLVGEHEVLHTCLPDIATFALLSSLPSCSYALARSSTCTPPNKAPLHTRKAQIKGISAVPE